MIKFLLIITFSMSSFAIDWEHPKLFFTVGYPYNSIQGNGLEKDTDFVAASIGGVMKYTSSDISSFNVVIDATYSPQRERIRIAPDDKLIEGRASLLTSFYSLTYQRRVHDTGEKFIALSFGPSIGLHTLNYDRFVKNNSSVSAKNRIRIRNWGLRSSILLEEKNSFFEIAHYYLLQNRYSVIDNATLDAQYIKIDRSVSNKISWSIILNYGMRIF